MRKDTVKALVKEELHKLLFEWAFQLNEEESEAAKDAHRLGLTADSWGRWKDKSGKVVAKTVDGKLVRTKSGEDDSEKNAAPKKIEPKGTIKDPYDSPTPAHKGDKAAKYKASDIDKTAKKEPQGAAPKPYDPNSLFDNPAVLQNAVERLVLQMGEEKTRKMSDDHFNQINARMAELKAKERVPMNKHELAKYEQELAKATEEQRRAQIMKTAIDSILGDADKTPPEGHGWSSDLPDQEPPADDAAFDNRYDDPAYAAQAQADDAWNSGKSAPPDLPHSPESSVIGGLVSKLGAKRARDEIRFNLSQAEQDVRAIASQRDTDPYAREEANQKLAKWEKLNGEMEQYLQANPLPAEAPQPTGPSPYEAEQERLADKYVSTALRKYGKDQAIQRAKAEISRLDKDTLNGEQVDLLKKVVEKLKAAPGEETPPPRVPAPWETRGERGKRADQRTNYQRALAGEEPTGAKRGLEAFPLPIQKGVNTLKNRMGVQPAITWLQNKISDSRTKGEQDHFRALLRAMQTIA